jgi:hypothetical protein
MKITKLLATAAGLAALTACGGNDTNTAENVDANLTDMNAGMDMNMPADNMTLEANNVTVVEGADANATTDMNADANATANTTNTM